MNLTRKSRLRMKGPFRSSFTANILTFKKYLTEFNPSLLISITLLHIYIVTAVATQTGLACISGKSRLGQQGF